MVSSMKINCHLAIAVVPLLLVHSSTAFFSSSKAKDPSSKQAIDHNTDLAALVRPMPEDQSGIYTHALQLLSSLQASPSCNRLATSTLLESCHSIDGSKHDAQASLEDARSIYAAQLAMCEIVTAEVIIPQSCKSLALVPESKSHRALSSKSIRKDQLRQCLQSLESRPQWWTSYSNSRQNAVVMCQAARVDIEKDELIKLHKSVVETTADANLALARATNQTNSVFVQLQNDFALAKQTFQDQLMQDLDASTAKTQSFVERLVKGMEAAVHSAMSRMVSATQEIESNTASMSQNVRKANADSVDLQKNVERIFQQVVEGSAELAATQTQQWDQSHELATELQGSLQNLRDTELNALLGMFYSIHNQLANSHDKVSSLIIRQDALDERLLNLDKSFAIIQETAETFNAAQVRQAELQSRHNENMLADMQTTRGVLDDVTSNTATLAPIAFAFAWIRPISLITFPLLVLSCINRHYALFAGLGIAFMCAVLDLAKSTSFNAIPLHSIWAYKSPHLLLCSAAAVFFIILAVGSVYYHTKFMKSLCHHKNRTASDLLTLGREVAEKRHTSWNV